MQEISHSAPLNRPAAKQPIVPDLRPDLHINILIASMAVGGAERCVYDILIGLSQRNPTGKLFLMHDLAPSYAVKDSERFRVFRLGSMDRRHKLHKVALEVLASPTPVLYTHLIRARDLRKLWDLGVITIPVIHNSQPGWHDPPEVYDHPQVPFIVAVSDSVANQLRTAGCVKPVIVIRHELQRWLSQEDLRKNRDQIREQYGIRKGTLLIGMVGQFKAHKAYPRAIRVLHQVQRFCPAKLMILGGWDHEYGAGRITYMATCRQALDLGVLPDVICAGSVHPVEPYYSAFDVFLNTSIYEGLSIATLEAIQSGCPVVTADVGGQREALSMKAALIEDPSDIGAYVEAIRRIHDRTERVVVSPPAKADLIPRLWCLIGRYGAARACAQVARRADTLFITSNLNPGGAQRSLTNLLCRLPSQHRAFLCVLGKVLCEDYLKAIEGSHVPVLALDHSASTLDRAERILDLSDKLGVRTICLWNLDPQIKLLIAKVLELRPIRIIDVSPGPMLFNEMELQAAFQQRIGFTAEQYFNRLDCFVTKYQNGGPPVHYNLPPVKVAIIPNGVPIPPRSNGHRPDKVLLPASADPALALVTCCRIVPNKRLEWLIDMMSILTKRIPGVTLTVVGGVDQRHIPYWQTVMDKMERAGLTNIYFAGSDADVFSFLRQFRVFVMVSYAQGCPNASLEAMAMGLPVVANADGGTGEQIIHGVNGFLVPGEDPSEMAMYVESLLKNPGMAKAFGKAGQTIARRKFSMELMVERYLNVLSDMPAESHLKRRTRAVPNKHLTAEEINA